ncbi:MAG: thiamine pyrophosphate-dependent dehydrogenase E1 component subunit alpha [Xanthobacteraceae bacterium]
MALSPRDLLARMLLMRRFEETVIHVARAHKLGRQHLAIGNEAVGAATLTQLQPGDLAYTTHRNHGHMVARGVDPGRALAEILGREGGLCGGKGGTWHMTDPSVGFQSTSAMVGGSIGLSVGGGFALKHKNKGNVAVALFGDGALDEGIAYEALNIASLYSLPVLFLCENNSKEGEAQTSRLATKELTAVPKALKIACATADGGDAEAAGKAAQAALAYVRRENAPYFLEAQLVRWPGSHQIVHEFTTGETDVTAAWDQARASNEHAEWQRTDPILRYARTLISRGTLTKEDVMALDKAANDAMAKARAFAEASPYPKPEAALAGVFV